VFRIQQRWAWTCNPASPAKLWWTGPISPSTTWNNQPAWSNEFATTTPANHRDGGGAACGGVGDIEFGVTGLVQRVIGQGAGELTVGLRAADEGTTNHWKRFNVGTPVIAIDYNTPPTMPGPLTVDGKACVAGAGRPFVATATPTLRAQVGDPDGHNLQVWYAYAKWDGSSNSFVDVAGGVQEQVPNGTVSQLTTAALTDGGIYTFRAQTNDYNGGVSPVTHMPGNCEWQVDLTDPSPPTVTGDVYPRNSVGCPAAGCGAVGQTGRFSFASSPDTASYRWGFTDPPSTVVTPATVGASVTVDWTPTSGGAKTLYVRAVDRAGRVANSTYQFTVAGPTPAIGRWHLDEFAGATTLADSTGNNHPMTLSGTGGTAGGPGRFPGARALTLTGTENVDINGTVLDTSRSFSVAAWVRMDDASVKRTVMSAMGTDHSSFYLWYQSDFRKWVFETTTADGPGGTYAWSTVTSDAAPAVGVWTHLAGTYDSASGQLSLYVNGVRQQSTVSGARTWNAGGRLVLGRTLGGDRMRGAFSDVQLFNRVISAGEVGAMVDPLAVGRVGEWHMDEVGPGPAFDASGMGHDLTFTAGASIPPAGAGQSGTGLRLDGPGERAYTDGPVIHTDQSFTVSAWVRVGDADPSTTVPDLPDGARTAVSQTGQWISGFFLGYRPASDGTQRWAMGMKDIDSDDGPWVTIRSTTVVSTADVGRWHHLVGVYDAGAATLTLYVDGALAGTLPRPSRWQATGPLMIGAAWWSPAGGQPALVDQWRGDLDEIRVYAGVVTDVARIP